MRRQDRILGGELPPECFDLVSGSTVSLTLPAPYDALDGTYEIEMMQPALDLLGESGECAMRIPAELVKTSESIFTGYNPAIHEETIVVEPYNGARNGVKTGGPITASLDEIDNGGSVLQVIKFTFAPSDSSGLIGYKARYKIGGGGWRSLPRIAEDTLDENGDVFGYTGAINPSKKHDIQVRALSDLGASVYVTLLDVVVSFKLTAVTAAGGIGEATFTATTPITNFKGVQVYRGAVGSAFDAAVKQGGVVAYASGTSISHTTTGQAAGTYDYWIAPIYTTNSAGAPSGPYTLPIT